MALNKSLDDELDFNPREKGSIERLNSIKPSNYDPQYIYSNNNASIRRPDTSYSGLGFSQDNNYSDELPEGSIFRGLPPSPSPPPHIGGTQDVNVAAKKWHYKHTLIYFGTLIVCALAVISFESYIYAAINVHRVQEENKYIEMSIYLSLFIFSGVYQVIMTFIGLRTKSMMLLSFLLLFYVLMVIYTGIQYGELHKLMSRLHKGGWKTGIQVLMICTIVVIGVCLVLQTWMVLFVLRPQVRWLRYKKIGGDYQLRRMYEVFQFHRLLLLFDFFFFLGFTVQFVVIMVGKRNSVEFILTVCVLPLTIILLVLADFAATRELLWLTICCMVLFVCGGVYVVFKVVRLFTKYTLAFNVAIKPGSYFPGRKSLVLFAVITLVVLLVTIVTEICMCFTYGKGLKPLVDGYYRIGSSKSRGKKNQLQQIVSDGEDGIDGIRMQDMLDSRSLVID